MTTTTMYINVVMILIVEQINNATLELVSRTKLDHLLEETSSVPTNTKTSITKCAYNSVYWIVIVAHLIKNVSKICVDQPNVDPNF